MNLDTSTQFSRTTVFLHWIIAISIIGLMAVGIYMENTSNYSLYPWHKAIGFLIFFVILIRVIWRVKNGWPTPASNYSAFEHSLAKLVHWVLILGTLLMPISGFLMSSLGGHGVDVFGWEVVAFNPDPENPQKALAHNGQIAGFAHSVHYWLGNILIAAIALHILGALKHHIIDKDGTIKRMLGKSI